jgi:hypothetical protein
MKNRLKQRDISINSTGSLSYTGFDELTTVIIVVVVLLFFDDMFISWFTSIYVACLEIDVDETHSSFNGNMLELHRKRRSMN